MSDLNPKASAKAPRPFVFVHVGDLHLDGPDAASVRDLAAILADLATLSPSPDAVADFLYLPGDIAEDGRAAQYDLLRGALPRAPLPVRLIAGDHDRQHGCMADFAVLFREVMGEDRVVPPRTDPVRRPLPEQYFYAEDIGGVRCLFLDLCSAGYGEKGKGLDFRLGWAQAEWLTREILATLDAQGEPTRPCAVFMHAYPDDLDPPDTRAETAGLFRAARVRLVEMGHTHYNELAQDGVTLYAAARSVGQNEDGSVGYAVAAIDRDVTSWRFKPLDQPWPFVLITSPADRRLATAARADEPWLCVRALVLSGTAPALVRCRVDDGPWITMDPPDGDDRCWTRSIPWPAEGRRLSVQAALDTWNGEGPQGMDFDVIEPVGRHWSAPHRAGRPGSDAFALGRWLQKGLRGDQLGPNRNGRHW
ncbi:metallophosphoesterase family protein [Methylobacterium soli]|uniref:Metallophosphoesterase n=1 Tax=Methylobacterium soli TaxID=553447 RepID=A0A6L3T855_9HYPH|nr:metallophosphoesterase [Methylobacterium soli]KAB1081761.1 metallophosphoesterase [Methylobacterium soli]GJE43187.1 3',5'-cyclic adenosine monophosphate phosphodiesterase CpdA [Methylobacterium soli]